MSKLLIGLVVGAAVALPVGALAWSSKQAALPFKVAHCSVTSTGEQDPNVCTVMVSKFQDGDNYCYVAFQNLGGNGAYHDPSIACVRDEP